MKRLSAPRAIVGAAAAAMAAGLVACASPESVEPAAADASVAAQAAADHIAEIVSTGDGVPGSMYTRLSAVSTDTLSAQLLAVRDRQAEFRQALRDDLPELQVPTTVPVLPGPVKATKVECEGNTCSSTLVYQTPPESDQPQKPNPFTLENVDGTWKLASAMF